MASQVPDMGALPTVRYSGHKAGCLSSPSQAIEAWKFPGELLVPGLPTKKACKHWF